MKKKVLSLLLILAMVLSVLPLSVFADGIKVNVTHNAASAKLFAESDDGMKTDLYTSSVNAGKYKLALYDDSDKCLGTIMLDISADNNEFTVYAVTVTCNNDGWILGTDYTVDNIRAISGGGETSVAREITLGESGNTFLCMHGDKVAAKIVPSSSKKAEGYAPADTINSSGSNVVTGSGYAALSAEITKAAILSVTYPYSDEDNDGKNDFILEVGQMKDNYVYSYFDVSVIGTPSDGMVTDEYYGLSTGTYFYRVTNPKNIDAITYGSYKDLSVGENAVAITESQMYIGDSKDSNFTVDDFSLNKYDVADIYLSVSGDLKGNNVGYDGAAGQLSLTSGNKVRLYPFRNWLAIEGISNAKVTEPDFHVQVVNVEGTPITVTENTENNSSKHSYEISAVGNGTAILLVTYDAMTHDVDGAMGGFFSAIWPKNTGVIVVTVGAEGGIDKGMKINETLNTTEANKMVVERYDAELDVLYYYGNDGASYNFKPESGTTVTMAKCFYDADGAMNFADFSADGVTVADDGTVMLTGLPEGKTIVKLVNGSKVAYQVIRAEKTDVTITDAAGNIYMDTAADYVNSDMKFAPGEKVSVAYSELYHPANKLSGIYNMSAKLYLANADGKLTEGTANQYNFASTPPAHKVTFTIPDNAVSVSEFGGALNASGFGSYFGYHRMLTYETGKAANMTAVQQNGYMGSLPVISLPVAEPLTANVVVKDSLNNSVENYSIAVTNSAGEAVTLTNGNLTAYAGKIYNYTLTVSGHPRCIDSFTVPASASGTYEIVLIAPDFSERAWDGTEKSEPAEINGVLQIGTGAELAWFAAKVNDGSAVSSNAALTADIDLSNMDWTPIGSSTQKYSGTFDGNGHYINGLYIDSTSKYQGLFGYVNNGTVKNLGVRGQVKGGQYTAGIAAYLASNGKVEDCVNGCGINGGKNTGGIAGLQDASASIENCYNTGNINGAGNQLVGGIAGGGSTFTIKNTIKNSYNLGTVYSTNTYGGAVNGSTQAANVTNSYYLEGTWTGTKTSNVNKAGISKTADDLKALAATLGPAYMPDVDNINNGYPILAWQHTHALTKVEAKDATCTEAGNTEYWNCSCGKHFSDAEGTTEIEEDTWIIPVINYHELKVLTFEGTSWDSLIDDPQYGGALLYGEGSGFDDSADAYQWTDSNTSLHSILSEGYGSYCFWNGGHAISHYVSGDASTYGDYTNQLTVFKSGVDELETSGGGNNGSDNFAVHYGYTDNSGWAMLTEDTLPSLSFSDGVARVIDSMYVNNICYAINTYTEGNGLTAKIGDGEWVKIVATGYNGTTKTKTSEFYLCNGPENIVTDWTKWDLSGLGKVTKVTFNITGSSDNGYGFSQPAYFAYDDVAVRMGDVIHTEAKDPTYTETGNVEYWTCSTCGKKFANAACTSELTDDAWVISPLEHTPLTKTDAKDATCTEDGNSAYWYCGECNKYYSDAACTTEIEEDSWIIKAQGHKLAKTNAKDATCTEEGNSAYWTCGVCGKYFSDEDGNTEVTENSWLISAKGHTPTKTDAKAASCTAAGSSAYWTCSACGKYFSDADGKTEVQKDSWVIQAAGHKDSNSDSKCDVCGTDLSTPAADNDITVYYTVLGDELHGDDGSVHTLKHGGLATWIAKQSVKVSKNATVWDVMVKAAYDLGGAISYSNSSGNYVSSITYAGESLGEFDNGALSGWMYTLNGTHPGLGVAQQKVTDGDAIVFHYTDDYTQEQGSEDWDIPSSGTDSTDKAAASEVIAAIDAIGDVAKDSKDAIEAARKAYDELTDVQKKLVTNYDTLVAAEEALKTLNADAPKFVDVPENEYYTDAVAWAVENGITAGVGSGKFGTGEDCTREQMVTFLWNLAGKPEASGKSFSDVADGTYYSKAIAWAKSLSIAAGKADGSFGVGDTVTREQVVTFLWNYAGQPEPQASASFGDVAADAYFAKAVAWAKEEGITSGIGGGKFGVGQVCAREQIVTLMYNYFAEK